MSVYCDWEGFAWIWSFSKNCWLIDVEKSGGPPSLHEKSLTEPPYMLLLKELDDEDWRWVMSKLEKLELRIKKLEKYGIPSPRLGGYEYMVATNLMIFEQLRKMSKEDVSMLDY